MKNWKDIAVGDSIFNKDGEEAKVLEVGASGKTFLRSRLKDDSVENWVIVTASWYTVDEAIRFGWTLGEKKKDKIEELREWLMDNCPSNLEFDIKIVDKVKELFGSNSA